MFTEKENDIIHLLEEGNKLYKEKNYTGAAEVINKIVDISPSCLLTLYSTWVDCYKKQGDIYHAMEVYSLLKKRFPQELFGYGGLATICLENNDFERAKIYFEQMLNLDVTLQQKYEINKQIAICNEGLASQQKESKKPSDMQEVQNKFTALQINESAEMPPRTSAERQPSNSNSALSPRCGERTNTPSIPQVPAR